MSFLIEPLRVTIKMPANKFQQFYVMKIMLRLFIFARFFGLTFITDSTSNLFLLIMKTFCCYWKLTNSIEKKIFFWFFYRMSPYNATVDCSPVTQLRSRFLVIHLSDKYFKIQIPSLLAETYVQNCMIVPKVKLCYWNTGTVLIFTISDMNKPKMDKYESMKSWKRNTVVTWKLILLSKWECLKMNKNQIL